MAQTDQTAAQERLAKGWTKRHRDVARAICLRGHSTQQRLHKLKLNGTRVGDDGARAIAAHCVDLRVLFAPKSRITDEGFVAICESCRHLSSISIVSTACGDRTFEALARWRRRPLNAWEGTPLAELWH